MYQCYQCGSCEQVFTKLSKDSKCPYCSSGNWVEGYIDCTKASAQFAKYAIKYATKGEERENIGKSRLLMYSIVLMIVGIVFMIIGYMLK